MERSGQSFACLSAGLFIIEGQDLPDVLHELKLRDFTGIAKSMEARLHAAGIHTTAELCRANKQMLHGVWGGVMGDRLWHLLRGDEIPDLVSAKKSIGHSHVLPPDSRHPDKAWPIVCKLLHKASERLRSHGLLTGSLTMQLAFYRGVAWGPEIRFPETDSTVCLMRLLDRLWQDRPEPRSPILQVGVVLTRLCERGNYTPPSFSRPWLPTPWPAVTKNRNASTRPLTSSAPGMAGASYILAASTTPGTTHR